MNTKEKIKSCIYGNLSLIAIDSIEIERVISVIKQAASELASDNDLKEADPYFKQGIMTLTYKESFGIEEEFFQDKDNIDEPSRDTPCTDIFEFLKYSSQLTESMSIIKIIPDFHLYLFNQDSIIEFVSIIRHIAKTGNYSREYYVFIGDITQLPKEVANLFNVLDFELPTTEEIINHLKYLSKEVLDIEVKSDDEYKNICKAVSGLTMPEIENAFRQAAISSDDPNILNYKTLYEEKKRVVTKSGLLEILETTESMDTVGGLDVLKNSFKSIRHIFDNLEEANKFGIKTPKGCLIVGVSGTGKTLMAKAASSFLGLPLYRCDIGRVFNSLVGETERNTRNLFKLISSVSPCVILFDEFEKMISGSESSAQSDAGVTSRFIGSLLYFLEDKKVPSYFIATANQVHLLPPEMLRKGRWDDIWFADLPNENERASIFKVHFTKSGRRIEDYIPNLMSIVKSSENFTGAEIEAVIQEALKTAFITKSDISEHLILNTIHNTIPLYNLKKEEIDGLRSWALNRAKNASSKIKNETKKISTIRRPVKK